jgi:hypothetical protein
VAVCSGSQHSVLDASGRPLRMLRSPRPPHIVQGRRSPAGVALINPREPNILARCPCGLTAGRRVAAGHIRCRETLIDPVPSSESGNSTEVEL